jgi:hypothetical protein
VKAVSAWGLERLEQIASGSTPPPRERQPEVALDPPELVPIQPEGVSPKPTPLTLQDDVAAVAAGTERAHTRIQWMLAKLAQDLGLRAWIARNDKNAVYEGQRLGDLSIDELPFRHERTYQGTIERIDVLWLRGHAIEGAFEIESTTAIYSGLLRMADLLALQPNLNIPLFIVAPDDRREHVLREIRRPTFTRLDPPLHSVCRYIAVSKLEQLTETHGDTLRYMRPDIIDSIAEEAR